MGIEMQCFKYGARRRAVVQRAARHAQAMCGSRQVIERTQPCMRQMDMGDEIVAHIQDLAARSILPRTEGATAVL
jgi:hypothetical protein